MDQNAAGSEQVSTGAMTVSIVLLDEATAERDAGLPRLAPTSTDGAGFTSRRREPNLSRREIHVLLRRGAARRITGKGPRAAPVSHLKPGVSSGPKRRPQGPVDQGTGPVLPLVLCPGDDGFRRALGMLPKSASPMSSRRPRPPPFMPRAALRSPATRSRPSPGGLWRRPNNAASMASRSPRENSQGSRGGTDAVRGNPRSPGGVTHSGEAERGCSASPVSALDPSAEQPSRKPTRQVRVRHRVSHLVTNRVTPHDSRRPSSAGTERPRRGRRPGDANARTALPRAGRVHRCRRSWEWLRSDGPVPAAQPPAEPTMPRCSQTCDVHLRAWASVPGPARSLGPPAGRRQTTAV